jgi:hypothetical protein
MFDYPNQFHGYIKLKNMAQYFALGGHVSLRVELAKK